MSKHGGAGQKWHAAVFGASEYLCQAEKHDKRCDGGASEAHHIVYRAHCIAEALWLPENGIALSQYCHMLAHGSHNANISDVRLRRAVDAVNAVIDAENKRLGPIDTYQRRPHFTWSSSEKI